MNYRDEYQRSLEQPEAFWAEKAEQIDWFKPPANILSTDDNGVHRWFADGELNTAYLALDYHVDNGRGEQVALYYDSPVTATKAAITYADLLDQVSRFAGALRARGVEKGERVIIYLPMIPEAVIAMLACARLGAIHCVVFGGFSSAELAARIDDATPLILVTASCGLEADRVIPYQPLYEGALELSQHQPDACIVVQRDQHPSQLATDRDCDWHTELATAKPAPCIPIRGSDPIYILYTSGTTGKPKGVVRDNGGHAVALKYSMKAIYDMNPGEVFWAASDVGWVVGHSYIVYAPLLAGLSSILYEGKPVNTPDAGAFWRVVEEYQVKALFAAPTAFRAIRKADPEGQLLTDYDLTGLKMLFVAGERLDPPTWEWLDGLLGVPVVDHWWQTETGWAISANPVGIESFPIKPGSSTLPVPGFDVRILDDEGTEMGPGETGAIVLKLPMPPASLQTIWGDFSRFQTGYLDDAPGYYMAGDGGYIDEDGYVFVMGRTDDVINVAGHRLSTGQMEEIVAAHAAVAECAVIGVSDAIKGQAPMGLVVLKDGANIDGATLEAELTAAIRREIGAFACFNSALLVDRLPKTRSGKILRKSLRQIAAGEAYTVPSTIDDPASLQEIAEVMSRYSAKY